MSHIFISYSKKNIDYATRLKDDLKKRGFDVWMDDIIEPGEDWWRNIRQAINQCAAFIVIMTPEAEDSHWVKLELLHGLEYRKPIMPLLRHGETNLLLSDNWSRLALYQYTDVRDGSVPTERFYTQLAKHIPPKKLEGLEVAPSLESASPVIELPPLPDVSGILPPPFEWCYVPAGKVTIEYSVTEKKTFEVAPFYMAKYPITNAQFGKFIEADGYNKSDYWTKAGWQQRNESKWIEPRYWRDAKWNGADYPVVGVRWYEALAFCLWLDERIRGGASVPPIGILLPDEKQWQRAAQGDDGRVYPWGNAFDVKRCNTKESGIGQPTPVTQYPSGASPFGVLDMSGNVWEWCLTRYAERDEALEGTDVRVLRGGSWDSLAINARAAYRGSVHPYDRSYYCGFRVVVAAPIRSGL